MTENYITLSLETHLFFARIMKEHSLFLTAGFPCKDTDWIEQADHFRQQFEELLMDVVKISNHMVNSPILHSGELVTEFTIPAEKQTERLSGIPINTKISEMEQNMQPETQIRVNRQMLNMVHQTNRRSLHLLNGLIDLKENILKAVSNGKLFTTNYPLLIQHILREAKLYRSTVESLMNNRQVSYRLLFGTEEFWNQIMMEHALFIRGLLDPSEEELIFTANDYAMDYKRLLELAKQQENIATQSLTEASLDETLKYREFKTAGTKGILNRDISSIILPILADHVLREANHYIRILEASKTTA